MAFGEGRGQITITMGAVSTLGSTPAVVLGFIGDDDQLLGAAADVRDWCTDQWTTIASEQYTIQKVRGVTDTVEVEYFPNAQGSDDDPVASPATSCLVKKYTGHPGPHGRGRSYWPGILFDSQVEDDGSITQPVIDAVQPIMDGLFTAMNQAPGESGMAILSSDGILAILCTAYLVQPVTATQRRRLRA